MKRKIYIIPLLLTGVLFLVLRFPYRDYIYRNEISDFNIADTSPNFLSAFLIIFLERLFSKYNDGLLFVCTYAFLSLIIYEVALQPFLFAQTFDIYDIFASGLGTFICFWICVKLENLNIREAMNMKSDLG
jgi:hypothetical protein